MLCAGKKGERASEVQRDVRAHENEAARRDLDDVDAKHDDPSWALDVRVERAEQQVGRIEHQGDCAETTGNDEL